MLIIGHCIRVQALFYGSPPGIHENNWAGLQKETHSFVEAARGDWVPVRKTWKPSAFPQTLCLYKAKAFNCWGKWAYIQDSGKNPLLLREG